MNTTIISSEDLSSNLTLTKSDLNKIKAAHAVREIFKTIPAGQMFYGHDIKTKCCELYPELKDVYLDTFLRAMREFCHNKYITVSRPKSKYMRIADGTYEAIAERFIEEKRLQEGR